MSDIEDMIRRIVRDELAKTKPTPTTIEHVTVAEYCRVRSICESTVRQAIAEKRLDVIRVGRAVRIPSNAEIRKRQPAEDAITEHARLVLLRGGKAR